jgi:16S rRNA (guanine(527)-N(7))-methyltransferase RsmG
MKTELRERLEHAWPGLSDATYERVIRFHEILAAENEKQNLTRLISPKDFVEGHFIDVRELIQSKLVDEPAMDLGSGCGVPGALAAILEERRWILAESERHKAEFLFKVVRELSLTSVTVVADRGESFLAENTVSSVVARAVGPIDRIYGWLRPRSTWNNLVLLKGPAWTQEWESFASGPFGRELSVTKRHEYRVGEENKQRVLVKLHRVPRGT